MEKHELNDLKRRINGLEYEDKKEIYQGLFSLGYITSEEMNDRLVLISLLALVTQKMKEQDKNNTALSVILKITGEKANGSAYYHFLEALAIIVEDFSYGIKKIDPCGLKTSQEIIKKIKELLNTWIPF